MSENSLLWVVGKYNRESTNWAFYGVFDSEQAARDACTTTRHFYAPATLNQRAPDRDEHWPGLVYPFTGAMLRCPECGGTISDFANETDGMCESCAQRVLEAQK